MAYQLRSRGDPVTTESQEQTDTLGEHLTEPQVTTPSQTIFIPQQLSETQTVALTTAEANRAQTRTDKPTKPNVETTQQLDTVGPTRLDPDLDSAALTARAPLTDTYTTSQQLMPAQASAFISAQSGLAEEIGPPSSVIASRDYSLTGNQPSQLHDTIYSSSISIQHDSQEVKQTTQAGITLAPDVVVARNTISCFHTSILPQDYTTVGACC